MDFWKLKILERTEAKELHTRATVKAATALGNRTLPTVGFNAILSKNVSE